MRDKARAGPFFVASAAEKRHDGPDRNSRSLSALRSPLALTSPLRRPRRSARRSDCRQARRRRQFGATRHGDPTYKISTDGTVDWYTYSGFRRYHSECHVCHGPDGEGSSVMRRRLRICSRRSPTRNFTESSSAARRTVGAANENVMPAFAENKNVMCYLDDIYIYLRARSQDAIPRGRPPQHADKPAAFDEAETKCMGE